MPPAATTRRRWPSHALALLVYTLLALVVTFPLPLHLGERIIANQPGQVDGYLGIWNVWWTAQALTTGQNPFVTPLLFHPQGLDLFWQTLSLPQGVLALPVTLAAGPLPAYNLLILLSFILGGYFTFLFIAYVLRDGGERQCSVTSGCEAGPHRLRQATQVAFATRAGAFGLPADRWVAARAEGFLAPGERRAAILAALIGGAVYAFAPFHMQKVLDAQLEVASVQWLPLWALATAALLERPRWPLALLSGAALLVVGLGTWYYGLFALIATGLMAGLWALRIPAGPAGPPATLRLPGAPVGLQATTLLWGLAPIVLWFAVMTPRLLSLLYTGDALLGDARGEQQAYADLISFWLPNPNHPLWGGAVTAFYERLHPGEILWNVSLGLVGIALALYGVILSGRAHWRWLALGVFAAAMALGAEIFVFGRNTGLPGPYALIRDLPGVRSSHRPNHFVLISLLTTALFAAAGARPLLARAGRGAALLAAALLASIIAIDGTAGAAPLFQRPMPRPYLSMPAPDGALLPVPLHLNFSNSEHLWYQTRHHWPIIGGFIGREPPYPLGRYAPGIKELRFGQVERDDILGPAWPDLARETLAAYAIRYVVFHHDSMGSSLPSMRDLVAEMGLGESYRDEQVTFYPVPAPERPRPLAYLGPGWGDLEQDATGTRWRWMGDAAQVFLLNPTGATRPARLTLDLEAFERPRALSARLGDAAPFSLTISRARMRRTLHLTLPPGETVLYLSAPADAPPGQPSRRLSLAFMGIIIE